MKPFWDKPGAEDDHEEWTFQAVVCLIPLTVLAVLALVAVLRG